MDSENWPYSGHQKVMSGIWQVKTGHIPDIDRTIFRTSHKGGLGNLILYSNSHMIMLQNILLTMYPCPDGTYQSICFCIVCRQRKQNTVTCDNETAEILLQITLDRIMAGKSFRQLCLSRWYNPIGYLSFGVWLTTHTNMSEAERKRVCHQMSEAKMICAHW